MKSPRRHFTALLSALIALILVCSLMPSAGRAQTMRYKIRQTGFRVLYMAPMYIGLEQGFFAQEGVDYAFQEISSGALGPATVVSGQAQVSDTDPVGIADLQKEGKSLISFYNLVRRVTLDLIVRNEVIRRTGISRFSPLAKRYAVLKGLNIGITRPGAATDVFARYFLVKAGLNPDKDANLVQVGGVPALAAAFRSGRIDAFLLSPPLPQTLEREHLGQIIVRNTAGDVPDFKNTTYTTLFTSADYMRTNTPALQAYARAVTKATAWIRANKADALRILGQKYFQDTPADSLAISLDATLPAISPDGRFTEAAVAGYLNIFKAIGQPVTAPTREGVLWTNAIVK
jgi:ABC-type nitrate/sulfonate/bicarbonate transport system substrate-binding protein